MGTIELVWNFYLFFGVFTFGAHVLNIPFKLPCVSYRVTTKIIISYTFTTKILLLSNKSIYICFSKLYTIYNNFGVYVCNVTFRN